MMFRCVRLVTIGSHSCHTPTMWMATKASQKAAPLSEHALAQLFELKPSLPEMDSLPTMEESMPKEEVDEALIPLHDPIEPRKFPFQVRHTREKKRREEKRKRVSCCC
jgi:hypothetical protein